MSSTAVEASPWRSGLHAARKNLLPGVVLQAASLGLMLGYYYAPAVHQELAGLVAFRERTDLPFAAVSGALFGGVLPFLYLHFGVRDAAGRPHYTYRQGLGLGLFWAYRGVEVDLWYRLQQHFFGPGHAWKTVAIKSAVDQLGYSPIWAVPTTAAFYVWVDAHYDGGAFGRDLRSPRWFQRRVLPVMIANMAVWLPAVAIIYSLPTPLQLPLQNIVLCFYTLIVAHQTKTAAGPGTAHLPPFVAGTQRGA